MGGWLQAEEDSGLLRFRQLCLLHFAVKIFLYGFHAALEIFLFDVPQYYVVAGPGKYVRDAVAHGASTKHRYGLNVFYLHSSPFFVEFAIRCQHCPDLDPLHSIDSPVFFLFHVTCSQKVGISSSGPFSFWSQGNSSGLRNSRRFPSVGFITLSASSALP